MSAHNAAAVTALARAAALSLYAGQEGQINLHKLLDAAVDSLMRSAAYVTRATTSFAALGPVLADLEAARLDPALLAALEAAAAAVARGEVPLIDAAPDVYVCRVCGQLALGAPPARCGTCGAWPGTFRPFRGIFNVDNPDPIASLDLLTAGPAILGGLLADLSEEQLTAAPAPGAWSLGRALQHLFDAQNLLSGRLARMLTEDDPPLAMEATWARPAAAGDTAAMYAAYCAARAATVARLEALPLRAWARTGRHTEFGRVTVLQQVGYFAYHEVYHYPDFVEKRRQLGL
jgi:hypothetical protein